MLKMFKRIPLKSLCTFLRQLSTMQDAGVGISKTLETLKAGARDGRLKSALDDIISGVAEGDSLYWVMTRHRDEFRPLVVELVGVGESGGRLEEVCRRLADYYEWLQLLRRNALSSLAYPIVLFLVAHLVFAGILSVGIFELFRTGSAPGWDFSRGTRFLTQAGCVYAGIVVIYFVIKSFAAGSRALGTIQLGFPVVKKVYRKVVNAKFTFAFRLLYASGVPLPEILEKAAASTGNAAYVQRIESAREVVIEGGSLTEALATTGLYDADYLNIVESGEHSGRLEQTFDKLSEILSEQAEFVIKWAVKVGVAVFYGGMLIAAGAFIIYFWLSYFRMIGKYLGGGG